MSYIPTVHMRWYASALTCAGLFTLATGISGAPRHQDSAHSGLKAKPTEIAAASSAISNPSASMRKVVQHVSIPFSITKKPTSQLRTGTSRTIRSGKNGEKEVIYKIYSQPDGTELRREVASSRIVKQPEAEVVEEGHTAQLPSRGYFSGRRVITMNATWYDPYDDGSNDHGRTFTGVLAGYGVVAVDPHFMPLGTRLYIEGYGYAVAADTGGAIKGNRIDLAIDSQHDVKNVKDMKHVIVHIID